MSDNGEAFRLMEEFGKRIRSLPDHLIDEAGPGMASDMEKALRKSAGAAQTPEGKAWKPRKEDGGKALPKAPSNLNVVYFEKQLIAVIPFPYSLHHWGKARNSPQRKILPDGIRVVQGSLTVSLERAFRKHFT